MPYLISLLSFLFFVMLTLNKHLLYLNMYTILRSICKNCFINLSICIEQFKTSWTNFHQIWYYNILVKFVDTFWFSIKLHGNGWLRNPRITLVYMVTSRIHSQSHNHMWESSMKTPTQRSLTQIIDITGTICTCWFWRKSQNCYTVHISSNLFSFCNSSGTWLNISGGVSLFCFMSVPAEFIPCCNSSFF